jgi:hypothetical protein
MKYKAFHGTNGRFGKFEQSKARIANDLYGGGVAYFTDTLDIAKSYASSMARRLGGEKYIYEVELDIKRMFDVDTIYTGKILLDMIGNDFDTFARGAKLFRAGDDRLEVISKLKSGQMNLNGDQVFRGMSNGMVNTKAAREKLIRLGFDGLRYNGGVQMGGNRHSVYLAYKAEGIVIKDRFIVSDTPLDANSRNQTYKFIN